MSRNQILTTEIDDGELRIRIGLDVLKYATETHEDLVLVHHDEATSNCHHPLVTDADVWAKEILRALDHISVYSNTTLVEEMLDTAIVWAVEQGAEGIQMPEDDDYKPYSPYDSDPSAAQETTLMDRRVTE